MANDQWLIAILLLLSSVPAKKATPQQCLIKFIIAFGLLFFSLFTPTQSVAQVKEFEKYADKEGVTYVYISKTLLSLARGGMLSTPSVPSMKTEKLIPKLSAIQIITSEDDTARKLFREASKIVSAQKYELLMQIDDDGDKVKIYFRESSKQSVIIMISSSDDDETNVLVFSGKFTLKDVQSALIKPK